jgi:hypothetical protein
VSEKAPKRRNNVYISRFGNAFMAQKSRKVPQAILCGDAVIINSISIHCPEHKRQNPIACRKNNIFKKYVAFATKEV